MTKAPHQHMEGTAIVDAHTVHLPIGGVIGTSALQRDIAQWGPQIDGWRLDGATYDDSKQPRTFSIDVSRVRTGDREHRRFELAGPTVLHPDGEWIRIR